MKRSTLQAKAGFRLVVVVVVVCVLAPAVKLFARAPIAPVVMEAKPLFNGTDLEGWILPDLPGLFQVENGVIVGRTDGTLKKNEFLVTKDQYSNFVLRAKVKLTNGNSGIQFRSKRADNGAVSGPQADVADGYWGLLYEERGRGILDKSATEKAKSIVNPNDYNEYVILMHDKHLTIKLNGELMIDRMDPEFADSGVIALQVHVGPAMEVRFKDITIEELR